MNKYNAETDANAFIQINGEVLQTVELALTDSNYSNPFEKGQTDVFQFESSDIGEVKNITLRHDNTGSGASWIPENVVIVDTNENEAWKCTSDGGFMSSTQGLTKVITCSEGKRY